MNHLQQRQILINYLLMKTDIGDWHAVSDAANDLRELETYIKYAPEVVENKTEPEEQAQPKDASQQTEMES